MLPTPVRTKQWIVACARIGVVASLIKIECRRPLDDFTRTTPTPPRIGLAGLAAFSRFPTRRRDVVLTR
jgi:hypothetical protein